MQVNDEVLQKTISLETWFKSNGAVSVRFYFEATHCSYIKVIFSPKQTLAQIYDICKQKDYLHIDSLDCTLGGTYLVTFQIKEKIQ